MDTTPLDANTNVAGRARWSVAALLLALAGCDSVELYSKLPEREANEMMAILVKNDIACTKQAGEEGTWKLSVQKSQFADSVDVLKELGYPKETFSSMGQVFQKSGLVSSPSEERIRFMHALSQELSHTLSQIDGVQSARVHIVLPNNNPFGEEVRPSSAAVFIRHRHNAQLEEKEAEIKEFVMAAIEGLKPETIKVSMFQADEPTDRMETSDESKMASVLSLRVARDSVPRLWGILGATGALTILATLLGTRSLGKPAAGGS